MNFSGKLISLLNFCQYQQSITFSMEGVEATLFAQHLIVIPSYSISVKFRLVGTEVMIYNRKFQAEIQMAFI